MADTNNNNYYNEIQNRLASYYDQLPWLKAYKNLNDLLNWHGAEWITPIISQNRQFIADQAKKYDDIFAKKNIDQATLDNFNNKYWQAGPDYKWNNLSTALPKMTNEYAKTWAEILWKIESLWSKYWDEKAWFFDKIQKDADALKSGIVWNSQEQEALTEWLTTRRGMWTKAMEDVSKAWIKNQENAQVADVDKSETAQLKETANLYNQLLSNLIQQYKETKDKYVLEKIQNAVNVLNLLKQYWSSTAQ